MYQVNNDIFAPVLSPFRCHFADVHNRLWVVGIDVENWSADDTSYVGAVWRRTRRTRISCESNLNDNKRTYRPHGNTI